MIIMPILFDNEIIKDILNYEKLYAITSTGRVWSYPKGYQGSNKHSGKWLKFCTNDLYNRVVLCNGLDKKRYSVHRLIALTFIPNPENKPQVNHIDGNKQNNHVSNLEWCTSQENNIHAYKIGLNKAKKGNDHFLFGKTAKNAKRVKCIELNIIYESITHAAKMFNIHPINICKVCQKKRVTALGYHWEYYL